MYPVQPRQNAVEGTVTEPRADDDNQSAANSGELHAELNYVRAQLHAAHAREAALEAELLHRVRNLFAVVRSIFSRTLENAETLEHVADHFYGRLDTLARYQLRANPAATVYLEDMVRETLLAFAAGDDPRITIEGNEVALGGRHAETIGMALHELATNSVKFGVLARPQERGALQLRWQVADDRLRFEWLETGVSVLSAAPFRHGFGREYIEQAVVYQLGAETSFELSAGRVRCVLDVPLTPADVVSEAEPFRLPGVDHT
jgi:two-component system CheB/CheR fusion protein